VDFGRSTRCLPKKKSSSGIDYSKWDHLDVSDDEEEKNEVSQPTPFVGAIVDLPSTMATAITANQQSSSSAPVDMANLKTLDIFPWTDLENASAAVAAGGGGVAGDSGGDQQRKMPAGTIFLSDPSKVFHTEDGKLIIDQGNGEKLFLKPVAGTNGGQIPSLTERLGATACFQ
jgi:hypothetical protein